MSKFTIKNGRMMTVEEAAKTPRQATGRRAEQLARLGSVNEDGSLVTVKSARKNTKSGGKK